MICFDLYLLVLLLYSFLFVSWDIFQENFFLRNKCEFSGRIGFANCYMICLDLSILVLLLYSFLFVSWNIFRENFF